MLLLLLHQTTFFLGLMFSYFVFCLFLLQNVKTLPEDITKALRLAYQRYTTYLDAFGPEEVYLKKKVETELGTKMIHLKMRCSGLGSEWGKVIGHLLRQHI